MIKILFICHGNICRSAMAEYVMKDLIFKEKLNNKIYIESKATSSEELGNPVYPPVKRILNEHNINCNNHMARRMSYNDYDNFDLLIGMDDENIYNMNRMFNDKDNKIHLLTEYSKSLKGRNIADPWYTRDFMKTWEEVNNCCNGLLEYLKGVI